MSTVRVLLVDDSPEDAEFVTRCLQRRMGGRTYDLTAVESGADGLQQCRANPPDCLLLDHSLPDMDGIEILSALGMTDGSPPFAVVMLTGSGDDDIAVTVLRAGADDYLIKGQLSADGLRRAIENAIEKCRLRTERAAAEAALRASEERLKLVVEASHDGIWEYDFASGSLFMSDRVYSLLGLGTNEPIDRDTVLGLIHPDDRRVVSEAASSHVETGAPERIEFRMRRADGEFGWFLVSGKILRDPAGRPARMAGALGDITERKRIEQALRESDERFRLALLNAPIVVFTQDRDLRYTWVHKAVDGLNPADLLGRTDRELVPAEFAGPVEAIKQAVLASGTASRSIVAFPVMGGESQFDLSVEPFRDADGDIVGVICVAIDVTAQQEFDRARETFLATISHELRNPLAALSGYAQLMQRRGTYNERAVNAIVGQTARMRTLIDDLLDITRLSIGKLDLMLGECDLAALAQGAAERAQVSGTGHAIRTELPDTPVVGQFDPTRIAQVLDNLLSNAIKYSPNGGEIVVRLAANDDEACLQVQDHGIGIPVDVLPQLFDRFYRVGEAKVQGLGLGLHITRELVHGHGGRIEVASEPGQGSRFTLYLPISDH